MKKKRHELILEIIADNEVSTQEELLSLLQENGCQVTQATVSRDIKELQLVKAPSKHGPTKYAVSQHAVQAQHAQKFYTIFSQSVLSVESAGNFCAVKCYAGTANAAGAAIDSMHMPQIVGTLAGDDTLFVMCRDDAGAIRVKQEINAMLLGDE